MKTLLTRTVSTKELNGLVKDYILKAINGEAYDKQLNDNPKERLIFLYNTFKSEYKWMIERVGEYNAFKEWIMGLPSCFDIDFTNYNILQLAIKWGSISENASEKEQDYIISNWFNLITAKTFQLFNKYNVK